MSQEYGTVGEDLTLRERIERRPQPAVAWLGGLLVMVLLEFGALMGTVMTTVPWQSIGQTLPLTAPWAALAGIGDALADLPTLLSREVIPNQGYQLPGEGWQGTFLGLEPGVAWAFRVLLIYGYSFVLLAWTFYGYELFRRHYRAADWTPYDDMLSRLDGHRWGQFGFVIVFAFVVMAVFAPALGPTTVDRNIANPYENEIQYYDENAGEVMTTLVGNANLQSVSKGAGGRNVGPGEYDDFGRFHPFGTLPSGKDLFTFMVAGARVSLFIGLLYITLAAGLAIVLALLTAYYKGLADLAVVIAGDSVQALPQLLVLILLSFVLSDTWIADIYDGGAVAGIDLRRDGLAVSLARRAWARTPGLDRRVDRRRQELRPEAAGDDAETHVPLRGGLPAHLRLAESRRRHHRRRRSLVPRPRGQPADARVGARGQRRTALRGDGVVAHLAHPRDHGRAHRDGVQRAGRRHP
jgi:ABC-type dipeptide/oligopeptide/nickel transport systems, permease components